MGNRCEVDVERCESDLEPDPISDFNTPIEQRVIEPPISIHYKLVQGLKDIELAKLTNDAHVGPEGTGIIKTTCNQVLVFLRGNLSGPKGLKKEFLLQPCA